MRSDASGLPCAGPEHPQRPRSTTCLDDVVPTLVAGVQLKEFRQPTFCQSHQISVGTVLAPALVPPTKGYSPPSPERRSRQKKLIATRALQCNRNGAKETCSLLVYCITIARQLRETDHNWFLLSNSQVRQPHLRRQRRDRVETGIKKARMVAIRSCVGRFQLRLLPLFVVEMITIH